MSGNGDCFGGKKTITIIKIHKNQLKIADFCFGISFERHYVSVEQYSLT